MRRKLILAEIHTPARQFVRQLVPQRTDCQLRFNAASVARLTVRDSHPVVADVMPDGMRAVVWLVTIDGGTLTKRRLLEGPIGDLSGEGPLGTVTIPVTDDFGMLSSIHGWPNPDKAYGAQTSDYARYTGPSESRALAIIQANITRLGLPWDVAVTQGRGTTGTTEMRMDPLADKILDPLTADRLQLNVARDAVSNRWKVTVTTGDSYPRLLTPQSGVLAGWQWTKQRPTATRVMVAGAGSGIDQEFAVVTDTALEAALGTVLEAYDNESGAQAGGDLTSYGLAALKDHAGKAGVTATLRETSWFQFPTAYDIGTKVRVQVGAVDVEDVITEVNITHTAEAGFTAVPRVGLAVDNPTQKLVGFVSGVAASVRSLERRR